MKTKNWMFLAFVSIRNIVFPNCLLPLFQNESSCETIYYEDAFTFHENESRTRFETEARGGSEISYYFIS